MDIDTSRQRIDEAEGQRRLSARLLERLKPLAADPARPRKTPGVHGRGRQLFSYCCFEMERISRVSTPDPLIGIVLSGAKEFWLGDQGQRFGAGTVFVLPAGPEFDAVNIPDERSGLYESLLVEVSEVPLELANIPSRRRPPAAEGLDLKVRLTTELVDALAHAAIALQASDHATTLAGHRLAEVLLLLREQPAAHALFDASLTDRVAWLVLSAPARRWTAQDIGQELGLGGSTLRRRLAKSGTSLREVLSSTRMTVAHRMLASGEGNVLEAAVAAGYASRSHFVRRFRSIYGAPPSEHRARRT